ncbi:MAG: DUF3429 family protein [Alphaproteobacteria bacterium]|jgi:hypothetical protein|nr:DUF3429 family protein [Alphaproteobacteria bacterium]
MATPSPSRGTASLLGFLGLVPFVGLALAAAAGAAPFGYDAEFALVAYGATILSFLGGIQWGFLLSPGGPTPIKRFGLRLALGTAPQLLGWAALLWASPLSLMLLAVSLAAHLAVDARAVRDGLAPSWFMSLRTPLSLGAAASLVAAALV